MHAHAYAPWNVECEISVKFGVFRPSGATRITRCTNQADILDKRVRNGFTRVPDMALIGKWGIRVYRIGVRKYLNCLNMQDLDRCAGACMHRSSL